jgi:transposase
LAREDLPSQCSPLRFHHRSIGIGWEASISFFEALAASIDAAAPRPSRAKGGRPPYPTVLMVKILVLQQLYNLADDALEYQLLDRRSFLQFLDLTESSSIPDAKTIWLFRDRLAQAGAGTLVFEQVQQQLQQHGYMARCGQIVDASLVQAPVQRNKREEADTVKEGPMPLGWKPHKRAQKDVDARWTKKHGKSYFGYKLHAAWTSVTSCCAKWLSRMPPWPTPRYLSRSSIAPTPAAMSLPIAATPPRNGKRR